MAEYFFVPSKWKKELNDSKNSLLLSLTKRKKTGAKLTNPSDCYGICVEKYKISSGPRLLWKKEQLTDGVLYVLRDALLHNDYDRKYSGQPQQFIRLKEYTEEEKSEVESEMERLNAQNDAKTQQEEASDLTEAESQFLNQTMSINSELFKDMVYESRSWLNFIRNNDDQFMSRYCECLLDHIIGNSSEESEWSILPIENRDEQLVVYHQTRVEEDGTYNDWILLGIIKPGDDAKEKFSDLTELLQKGEDARRGARRAYPFTMLEDKDYWQRMEQDTTSSNLILSSEESDIISGQQEYPLFITGRAGSGKSTVLQYMFAEIMLRFLEARMNDRENTLAVPLYLSYSENLVNKAKELMESLFKHNHVYLKVLKDNGLSYENSVKPLIEGDSFKVFGELVRELIQQHKPDDLKKFDRSKHISFAEFRKKWTKKFGNTREFRKYPPSLCWHVIRTYIKGWKSEGYLTPEEYEQVGRDNSTVKRETYQFIFDKVWTNWYSKLMSEDGYWDDQDLVRFCLRPSASNPTETCVVPRYSAIFCDESQDFSHVELELILGLNTLQHRKLDLPSINRIPFVFVGDEFQTLNPTGFSWNSLRSYFTNRLASQFGKNESDLSASDPIQLVNNYRSTSSIVKLGNRIQLLRAAKFGQNSPPQQTHFTEVGAPVFYLPDTPDVWAALPNKKIILIVPSDEGMSVSEYIESSPLKGKMDLYDDGTPVGITVLNPAQAKGMDYENVALYGFGTEESPLSYSSIRDFLSDPDRFEKDEADIDTKYLLNNAYVAATRAKERLYIIDKSINSSLWGIALESSEHEELKKDMMERVPSELKVLYEDGALGWILPGTISDVTTSDNHNWAQEYEDMERMAWDMRNAENMLQVANRYKEMTPRMEEAESRAKAKAYVIKEDYEAAVREFLKASDLAQLPENKARMLSEAIKYVWQGINEENVEASVKKLAEMYLKANTNELAKLGYNLHHAKTLSEFKSIIYSLLNYYSRQEEYSLRTISRRLIQHAINSLPDVDSQAKNDLADIAQWLNGLINEGDFKIVRLVELIAKTNNPALLITLCEKQKYFPQSYYKAKVETTPYPENVKFFDKLRGEDWREKVYSEFIRYPDASYNHADISVRLRIEEAIALCDSDPRRSRVAAAEYLSLEPSFDSALAFISLLEDKGMSFNRPEAELLLAIRLKNFGYQETITKADLLKSNILAMSQTILSINQSGLEIDNRFIRDSDEVLNARFKQVDTILATPFLLYLGEKFESRGQHNDTRRYYTWALTKANKSEQRLFRLLKLKAVEMKETLDRSGEWKPNMEERAELGIGLKQEDLTVEIKKTTQQAWKRVSLVVLERFTRAGIAAEEPTKNIVVEPQKETEPMKTTQPLEASNPEPVSTDTDTETIEMPQESVPAYNPYASSASEDELQSMPPVEFILEGLSIQYFYAKRRLVIRYNPSSLQITVSKGQIKANEEEMQVVTDGVIELEGKRIPVSIRILDGNVIVAHLSPSFHPTGVIYVFPV